MDTVNSKSEVDSSHDLGNLTLDGARCQDSPLQGLASGLQNGTDRVSAESLVILVQSLPFWLAALDCS